MSIKIRLARGGRKSLPFYSIVATNSTSPRDSKFLEKIGTYNPSLKSDDENRVVIKYDRAACWLSVGATPTQRVANFLINFGVAGSEKYKPEFISKEKGDGAKKKAVERAAKAKEKAEEKSSKEKEKAEEKSSKEKEVKTEEVAAS
jgi:small subunit ribosomal protein S16